GDGSRVAGSDATAGAPATPALDSFVHCHDEYAGGAGMCAIVRPCPAGQPGRDEPRCLRYPDPSYNAYGAVAVASRCPDAPTPVRDGTRQPGDCFLHDHTAPSVCGYGRSRRTGAAPRRTALYRKRGHATGKYCNTVAGNQADAG